ncbi:unnamed protein product [Discula destructiva]
MSSSRDRASPIHRTGQNCDSGLEELPPEVRRYLLSVLDLARLEALVHASPVFHQQYLCDRRYLLCASIDVTLQSVALDAQAIQESEKCTAPDHFTGLVETWGRQLSRESPQHLAISTTEHEASRMVSQHFQTIVPIAKHFAKWALDELARQANGCEDASSRYNPASLPALRHTEWLRCLRAVYRFQLLCNVASPAIPGLTPDDVKHNSELLFHALTPWEVEELFSFYQFAKAIYNGVFDSIENELRPDNPRFAAQDRPPTPEGAFGLDEQCRPATPPPTYLHYVQWPSLTFIGSRNNFLEGTILQGGLVLLFTILFDTGLNDQERLASLMQRSIVSSYIPINALEGILGESQQSARRRGKPTPGDRMTRNRTPFPFSRDDLSEPPLAWTLIWSGTYSNLYGWYTSDEMRRWAYVFWDAERMEKWGGRELLRRQWEEYWGAYDARVNLF